MAEWDERKPDGWPDGGEEELRKRSWAGLMLGSSLSSTFPVKELGFWDWKLEWEDVLELS